MWGLLRLLCHPPRASETSLCQLRAGAHVRHLPLHLDPATPPHASFASMPATPLLPRLVLFPLLLDDYLSPARAVTFFSLYPVGVLGPGDQEAELSAAGGSPVARVVAPCLGSWPMVNRGRIIRGSLGVSEAISRRKGKD